MHSTVGHTFLYNMLIFFIVVFFAFIFGTISYYKAFKVNNRIVHAIEKYEGYNTLSKQEIDRVLRNLSYAPINDIGYTKCPTEYKGMTLVTLKDNQFDYCVYIDKIKTNKGDHYIFGVLTYMRIDLPVINNLRLKVFSKTNQMYKFTNDQI